MQTINTSGRRKNAIARVYMTQGTGKVTINKRDLTEYFPLPTLQYKVKQPFVLTETLDQFDIKANLDGGGITGLGRGPASRHLQGAHRSERGAQAHPEGRGPHHPRPADGGAQEVWPEEGAEEVPVFQALISSNPFLSIYS